MTCDCPPWLYKSDTKPAGLINEIVQELARRSGTTAEVIFLPWPRAFQTALREPGVMLTAIGRTPEREAQFQWVGPIGAARTKLYRWKTSAPTPADLVAARPRVGVVRGYAAEKWLVDAGFPVEVAGSDEASARMFVARRFEVILSNDLELAFWLKRLGRNFADVEVVFARPDEGHDYLGFSKGTPKATVDAFAAALRQMQADGSYARLLARHPGGADYAVRR